ncbi:universal stress protein [Rhizobium puerariae]|uniref:Universal stress protein n=1 Tax=Rhizobium puerariae TaxID=1585791 RepID=A0ABV6A9B2_9HYPH
MSFKTVLAVVGATDAAADISKAAELALELDAHLSLVAAGLALPPTVGEFPTGTAWLDQRYEDIKVLDDVQKQAETVCRANGLSFEIGQIYAESVFLAGEILQRALYADVIVVSDGVRGDRELTRAIVDGGVLDAHRPFLLVPKERRATFKPKTVLLAWNSRTEAARAAREALGMLVSADAVHVVLVDPDTSYWRNGGEPGADAATYLSRHGVKTVVEQLASGGRPVEQVLEQHALDINADLIVMGAYGHSRLRQRIFGGVTASMLKDGRFPVFLAR